MRFVVGSVGNPLSSFAPTSFALAGLAIVTLAVSACGHAPAKESVAGPTLRAPTPSPSEVAPLPAPTVATTIAPVDPLDPETAEEPPEPKNSEEAVAIAVAEQNLLDRIRAGFAMPDAEHVAVDREVAWFARHDDYLDRTFRRAERYLYFIVSELESRKMPLELALLPIVESAFNPVALSKARAAGLWQFIPSTGKRYGLEQNHQYDGRRDVMESTRAALDYLQFLANEFEGDWYHAVAAYNAGEMNVERAIKRNQARGRPIDFFSLDLPRETRSYVPKLLAMRRIIAHPENYGLEFGNMPNQPYFAKVEIDGPIDLGVAAQLAGMPKEDLIALNPAYRRAVTTADGPGHILVPADRAEKLIEALSALRPEQRVPKLSYTVHRGDTIASIARKLGVAPTELQAANKLKPNALRVGQELVVDRGSLPIKAAIVETANAERFVTRDPNYVLPPIPPMDREARAYASGGRHTVRSGETLSSIARNYGVSLSALAAENNLPTSKRLAKGQKLWIPTVTYDGANKLAAATETQDTVQRITYVVRVGDTLSRIATTFRVQIRDLLNWNKLGASGTIKAGQKLVMYVADSRRSGG